MESFVGRELCTHEPTTEGAAAPDSTASRRDDLDEALSRVAASAARWSALGTKERVALLDRLLRDCADAAPAWLAASAEGKGISGEPDAVGQEWVSGPYVTLRYLRGLRESLARIRDLHAVRVPAIHRRASDGRAIVRAFPCDAYDRLFFAGVSGDVVMAPGIEPADVPLHLGMGAERGPATVLVLSAGNVSGMGPVDTLFHLFQSNATVLLKMNPVNSYMGDVIERALQGLIEEDFVRIVEGGPREGSYLCDHPKIDRIHLTGSAQTFDAVLYGTGAEASERKAERRALRAKPVTAELGGVGPAIVVPGRWTTEELARAAELIATIAFDGGGYSCGATDLIILPDRWPQLDDFIAEFRAALSRMRLRPAYYPGADQRYADFVEAHDQVEFLGQPLEGRPRWAFIRNLDPKADEEMCFSQEPFCAVVAEMKLGAPDLAGYLRQAVEFVHERVGGTLGITLLVPRSVQRDRAASALVERSIADLRYGTIGVNYHPSAAWVSGTTPWGGFQAPDVALAESGVGFTQNAMMLRDTEKTVVRAGLVGHLPAPVWLMGRGGSMCRTFSRLCQFEARRSPTRVPGVLWTGLGL